MHVYNYTALGSGGYLPLLLPHIVPKYVRIPLRKNHLRSTYLAMVTTALGGCWCLEQPNGSCYQYFPPFGDLLQRMYEAVGSTAVLTWGWCQWNCVYIYIHYIYIDVVSFMVAAHQNWDRLACMLAKVSRVSWKMFHYSSKSPKPHYAYANSRVIHRLDKGKLSNWKGKAAKEGRPIIKTCET